MVETLLTGLHYTSSSQQEIEGPACELRLRRDCRLSCATGGCPSLPPSAVPAGALALIPRCSSSEATGSRAASRAPPMQKGITCGGSLPPFTCKAMSAGLAWRES